VPKVALVLGAGGIVGGAFHAGVLAALADAGWDPRDADLVVGTSAGAGAGALLRGGVSPDDLVARARGEPLSEEGRAILGSVGPPPPPPSVSWRTWLASSPSALAHAARQPMRARPGAVAAAALPEGTTSTEAVELVYRVVFGADWPRDPLWLVAVRQHDNARVVFGRSPTEPTTVAKAVAASVAIPGVYRPVEVAGNRYIDGGVHSVHNADLVAGERFDLVVVSAPMSRASAGRPFRADPLGRRLIHRQLRGEVQRIERLGTPVVELAPRRADRAELGANPMDPERRGRVATYMREAMGQRLAEDQELRRGLAPLGL
jgi:NTE family protein